jgi:hypothetical protein
LVISGGSYGTTNIWETASGQLLVTLFALTENNHGNFTDEWFAYHPDGYYAGSDRSEKYISWRIGEELVFPKTGNERFHRPDKIGAALQIIAEARP